MQYLEFLSQVHAKLAPRTYLEIGVRHGHSMALSGARSIGIDPAYAIAEDVTIPPGATLYLETSDDYFAGPQPLAAFDAPVIDLAFIDGLHLYEFVLRDFMNVERYVGPGGVVIFDDVLPRSNEEALRDRETRAWTGDVWKIIPTLREARPDLILMLIRTTPTGLLLVLGGDLSNTELTAAYDAMATRYVDSGEEPPAEFVQRSTAVYPSHVVAAPFWDVLRSQRERGVTPAEGRAELLASLQDWATTTLTTAQAQSIHPSLTGKPTKPAATKTPAKKAAAKKAKKAPPKPPEGPARIAFEARRVARGLRRRLRKVLAR